MEAPPVVLFILVVAAPAAAPATVDGALAKACLNKIPPSLPLLLVSIPFFPCFAGSEQSPLFSPLSSTP
jgi:hypothetical protein